MEKISLSWKDHVSAASRHRSDFLDDIRGKAFDWDGDRFWLKGEDAEAINAKHWIGPSPGSSIVSPGSSIVSPGSSIVVPSLFPRGLGDESPTPHISRGLGDSIKKVASKVGLKQKKDCGCGKRQKRANKAVPYSPGVAKTLGLVGL